MHLLHLCCLYFSGLDLWAMWPKAEGSWENPSNLILFIWCRGTWTSGKPFSKLCWFCGLFLPYAFALTFSMGYSSKMLKNCFTSQSKDSFFTEEKMVLLITVLLRAATLAQLTSTFSTVSREANTFCNNTQTLTRIWSPYYFTACLLFLSEGTKRFPNTILG